MKMNPSGTNFVDQQYFCVHRSELEEVSDQPKASCFSRHRHELVVMLLRRLMSVSIVTASVIGALAVAPAPRAVAVPGPEIEYTYNVMVRRHYDFPGNDAIGYGFGICDKVSRGQPYASVMGDVKADVFPNDEFAANYVVSNAVGILCPAQIWNLRNSAAGYRPPAE